MHACMHAYIQFVCGSVHQFIYVAVFLSVRVSLYVYVKLYDGAERWPRSTPPLPRTQLNDARALPAPSGGFL